MIPAAGDYWLRGARLPSGTTADVHVAAGLIAAVEPAGTAPGGIDVGGAQLWPCFTDVHAHLDKGHVIPRAVNPDGTFPAALAAVAADRHHWSEADLRRRMAFGLGCAHAHGTSAVRTHLDSVHPNAAAAWRVFRAMRDAWAGRIALQAVALCTLDAWEGEDGAALADMVADSAGIMGGVTRLGGPFGAPVPPEFPGQLDRLFTLAAERGLDVDLHVDESGDPGAKALLAVAEAAGRAGFQGRVQCGHCCSLAVQPEDYVQRVIRAVADTGIAVVSLPMCNMYLQDRVPGRTPRWRGVTLVHELRAAGVPVSVASDNCGDPFYAYGDHDMVEVWREAVRILHLDHAGDWTGAVTATPASVMGGPAPLAPGSPADLVLFAARLPHELLSRPQHDRVVIRGGRALDVRPPRWEELNEAGTQAVLSG